MLSFHNDQAIKEKYLNRVLEHQAADRITQGIGWKDGKGCAVGCTLENYDHSRYPIELGLPKWLAKLEDIIFEYLPIELAIEWPATFLSAIPIGVDTEIVKHQIAVKRMQRILDIQITALDKNNGNIKESILKTIEVIKITKTLHENEINKNYCSIADWSAARAAAVSAERSADAAAWSADAAAVSAERSAWSADAAAVSAERSAWSARAAAWSARAAAVSARAAAWSAEAAVSAAWSAEAADAAAWSAEAADAAAWKQEADCLIECLMNLKRD